jgi:uncharacterized protein YhfF
VNNGAVAELWAAFRAAGGIAHDEYQVWAFGDSALQADELAALVVHGPKRATAGLLADYERDGEPLPHVGGHSVILDGHARPVAVIRTTEVMIKPLSQVDAAFAWDEGEGDRTLQWWRDAHERHFRRRCGELGMPFSDDLPTVFERFELLWPRG